MSPWPHHLTLKVKNKVARDSENHGVERAVDSRWETGPAFSHFWRSPCSRTLMANPLSSPLSASPFMISKYPSHRVGTSLWHRHRCLHVCSLASVLWTPFPFLSPPSCWLLLPPHTFPFYCHTFVVKSKSCIWKKHIIFVIFSLDYFAQHLQFQQWFWKLCNSILLYG